MGRLFLWPLALLRPSQREGRQDKPRHELSRLRPACGQLHWHRPPIMAASYVMEKFDKLSFENELELVRQALADKKSREKLRALARKLVTEIADLYREDDVERLPRQIVAVCMGQFDPALNRYGNQLETETPAYRFSFFFAWWTTRRIEQALKQR